MVYGVSIECRNVLMDVISSIFSVLLILFWICLLIKAYYHYMYHSIIAWGVRRSFLEFIPMINVDLITSLYIILPIFMFRSEIRRLREVKKYPMKVELIMYMRRIKKWNRRAILLLIALTDTFIMGIMLCIFYHTKIDIIVR